jgi:GNAT superfamily N-acetyltransferase
MQSRKFIKEDHEKYLKKLTKENMQQLFLENFGGWSDEVSEKKLLEVAKTGTVQLFFEENTFIGYVSFNIEKENSKSCLINDIHIKKEHQRKGFGAQILQFVIKKAKELHYNQLKVFVFRNNPAINFYQKNGFKENQLIEKSNTSVMVKIL